MITIDVLKQELARVAIIQDSTERVKSYRRLLAMAIDYIYQKNDARKPERASMLELVDSEVDVFLTNLNKDVKVLKVKDLLPYAFTEGDLNE